MARVKIPNLILPRSAFSGMAPFPQEKTMMNMNRLNTTDPVVFLIRICFFAGEVYEGTIGYVKGILRVKYYVFW